LAAAILAEDVARLAGELAVQLRSDAELAPADVAEVLVQARRIQVRLEKHQARLGDGYQEKEEAR
jgi:hypothetical protein